MQQRGDSLEVTRRHGVRTFRSVSTVMARPLLCTSAVSADSVACFSDRDCCRRKLPSSSTAGVRMDDKSTRSGDSATNMRALSTDDRVISLRRRSSSSGSTTGSCAASVSPWYARTSPMDVTAASLISWSRSCADSSRMMASYSGTTNGRASNSLAVTNVPCAHATSSSAGKAGATRHVNARAQTHARTSASRRRRAMAMRPSSRSDSA
jgi:hypothetical protein